MRKLIMLILIVIAIGLLLYITPFLFSNIEVTYVDEIIIENNVSRFLFLLPPLRTLDFYLRFEDVKDKNANWHINGNISIYNLTQKRLIEYDFSSKDSEIKLNREYYLPIHMVLLDSSGCYYIDTEIKYHRWQYIRHDNLAYGNFYYITLSVEDLGETYGENKKLFFGHTGWVKYALLKKFKKEYGILASQKFIWKATSNPDLP